MTKIKKNTAYLPIAIIAAAVFIAIAIWAVSKKSSPDNTPIASDENLHTHVHKEPAIPEITKTNVPETNTTETETNMPEAGTEPLKPEVTSPITSSAAVPSLNRIISEARTWQPVYNSWRGRAAPDFALSDIEGKMHKLSDYKGKKILLTFWATWCPPCLAEVPSLVNLRNDAGEDELAILAVSDESLSTVKDFVKRAGINYTVLIDKGKMRPPYGFQRAYRSVGVPCSFFIDPEGKIKLATAGSLSLSEIISILRAKN